MDSRTLHRYAALIGTLLIGIAVTESALASGARQGVKPQPGEIVLLRDVSARPAYRPAPPGMALIADPSPRRELGSALGAGGMSELSDDDYAAMGSGMADGLASGHGQTAVERVTTGVVGGTLGRVTGGDGMLSGNQMTRAIGGPMGAVGGATRGIGDQVRGALAQFPLGQPAGQGGK